MAIRLLKNRIQVFLLNTYRFFKRDVVFLHIPKAAGVSIYDSLYRKDSPGHLRLSAYSLLIKIRPKIKVLVITRDPIKRFLSAYNYLVGGGRCADDRFAQRRLSNFSSLEDFVLNGLEGEIKDARIEHFMPMSYWLNMSNEWNENMDIVDIDDFLCSDEYHSMYGISGINHLNKTKSIRENQLEDEVMTKLKEIYRTDYEQFGY